MSIEIAAAVIGAVAGAVGTAIVEGISVYIRNRTQVKSMLKELKASLISVRDFNKYSSRGGIIPTHVNTLTSQLNGSVSLAHELRSRIFYAKKYSNAENYKLLSDIAGGCMVIIKELEFRNWDHFKGRNHKALERYIERLERIF